MKKIKIALVGILEVRDHKTRELLLQQENLITNGGLAMAALQLGSGTKPLVDACIGTGSTAAQNADDDLEAEVDSEIPVFSRVQTTVANDTAQFVSLHTGGVGGWALREYGIKDTDGLLFNRVVFAAINLPETGELEFTYKVVCQRVA